MTQQIILEISDVAAAQYEALSPEDMKEVRKAAEAAAERAVARAAAKDKYARMTRKEAAEAFRQLCERASANLTPEDIRELEAELERLS